MGNFKERFFNIYFSLTGFIFYIFIFSTLSFGRAFSILHIDTPVFPVFITEIFLLLNIPILINKYKTLNKLPKIFLLIFLIYLTVSCCYLFAGILKHNPFALRDIVLSLYLLFLPITFIHLNNLKRLKLFIAVVILSNIVNLFSGCCLLSDIYPLEVFRNFIINSKLFNLGLYYGMMSSFLVSFYGLIKLKFYRLLALILLSFNVFMLIAICLSSLWVAVLGLFLFHFFMFKVKLLKSFIIFVPVLIFICSFMFYLDYKYSPNVSIGKNVINELKGFRLFVFQKPDQHQLEEPTFEEAAELSKIAHREKLKIAAIGKTDKRVDDFVENKLVKKFSREEVSQKNMNWRLGIWSQTLKFAQDSPWFGKGFGVYPVYKIGSSRQYPPRVYFDPWMVPVHNDLVTVFFKMGVFGLALFLFINIYAFLSAFWYLNKCKLGFTHNSIVVLLGAFIFWHVLALLFDVIDSPPTSIFLWIIIALIFSIITIDKSASGGING